MRRISLRPGEVQAAAPSRADLTPLLTKRANGPLVRVVARVASRHGALFYALTGALGMELAEEHAGGATPAGVAGFVVVDGDLPPVFTVRADLRPNEKAFHLARLSVMLDFWRARRDDGQIPPPSGAIMLLSRSDIPDEGWAAADHEWAAADRAASELLTSVGAWAAASLARPQLVGPEPALLIRPSPIGHP